MSMKTKKDREEPYYAPEEEEIKEYMELYNADEIGIDNPIDMEEAECLLLNSDKYYYLNNIRPL